jgi:hypothetical protein
MVKIRNSRVLNANLAENNFSLYVEWDFLHPLKACNKVNAKILTRQKSLSLILSEFKSNINQDYFRRTSFLVSIKSPEVRE